MSPTGRLGPTHTCIVLRAIVFSTIRAMVSTHVPVFAHTGLTDNMPASARRGWRWRRRSLRPRGRGAEIIDSNILVGRYRLANVGGGGTMFFGPVSPPQWEFHAEIPLATMKASKAR